MAAYTSTQNGDWNDAATWGGGGFPGIGDTADIQHDVTVTADQIVGTYPSPAGADVIVNDAGSLTINDDVDFTLRSGLSTRNNRLIVGAGVLFTVDTGTTGEQYNVYIGVSGDPLAGITVNGTALNRSKIRHIGNGSLYWDTGWNNGNGGASVGLHEYYYCDMEGLRPVNGFAYSSNLILDHCRFDGCGNVYGSSRTLANGDAFRISYCNFKNTTAATYSFLSRNRTAAGGGDDWRIEHCSFDKQLGWFDAVDIDHTGNYFAQTPWLGPSTYGMSGTWQDNFVVHDVDFVCRFPTIQDNYAYFEGSNRHPFLTSVIPAQDQVYDGNVFESGTDYGANESDGILSEDNAASAVKYTIRNNLVLPNTSDRASCTGVTCGGMTNITMEIYNNTWMCGDDGVGISAPFIGAISAGVAGQWESLRNNVFWAYASQESNSYEARDDAPATTPATGYVTEWDWNAWWKLNSTNRFSPVTGAALPATPDANAINEDPVFVDDTRDLANFAGTILGATGTDAQKRTAALAALAALNDPDAVGYNSALTGPAQIVSWVKDGFASTNPSYVTAGKTGGYVGAVQPVISTIPLLNSKVFVGGVGENGEADLFESTVYIGGVKQ